MAGKENLSRKVVVITGASSGFGAAPQSEFARAGAAVVLAARRDELLDETIRRGPCNDPCRAERR
jgi:NADP-dependent 3-hydroxy acid dehydrogenase YdfG